MERVPHSPPRIRVPVEKLAEGEHALGARVARYLGRVHRLRRGDVFTAFDPAHGLEADAEIVDISELDVRARIGPLRPARLLATREVTWIQALPKGEKMDSIVRDATELGVTRIIPATSSFTVVKLEGPRREARRQRWERIAREAARQCGRGDPPTVLPIAPWTEALAVTKGASAFCLHPRASAPLGPALFDCLAEDAPLFFAAGPEGGLSEDEVRLASEAGFMVVSLGSFVLRAETVAAAALGAVRVVEGMMAGVGEGPFSR